MLNRQRELTCAGAEHAEFKSANMPDPQSFRRMGELVGDVEQAWSELQAAHQKVKDLHFEPPYPIGGVPRDEWRFGILRDASEVVVLLGGLHAIAKKGISPDEDAQCCRLLDGLAKRAGEAETLATVMQSGTPMSSDDKPAAGDLQAVLDGFRAAWAKSQLSATYVLVQEGTNGQATLAPDTDDLQHFGGNICFVGTVGIGPSSEQRTLFFTLHYRNSDEAAIQEFQKLAAQGGAALLSCVWLKRLGISSFNGPAALWLAFLVQFGSPQQRRGYRLLSNLYAQSVLAIEGATIRLKALGQTDSASGGNPRPCQRTDFEQARSISAFVDVIHAHLGYLDHVQSQRSLRGHHSDCPDPRAGMHVLYAVEAARRLGLDVPDPLPQKGMTISEERKWFEALEENAGRAALSGTAEWAAAVQPRVSSAKWPEPSDAVSSAPDAIAEQARPALSKKAKALAVLVEHPDWTDGQIANAAGCHVKSLYRWSEYVAGRELLRKGRENAARGTKDADSRDLEAWKESDNDE